MNRALTTSAPTRDSQMSRRFNAIDERVRAIGTAMGALEMEYPVLIARPVLAQAEYDQAFPHLLMSAACRHSLSPGACEHTEPAAEWCLSPAVCYHTYAQLAGQVVDDGLAITARGRCFRAEHECLPGVRQIEFEMREIVFVGSPAWVSASLEKAREQVESLAGELGLPGDWRPAEDPFFLPSAMHKAVMQRLLEVKLEYQLRDPSALALASVNRHGAFFGQRFAISGPTGEPVHTGCVAIGLDRWCRHAETTDLTARRAACLAS